MAIKTIKLPFRVDLTPTGNIVSRSIYGTAGYVNNVEYTLVTKETKKGLEFYYYGDDDTTLNQEQLALLLLKHNPKL